MLFLDLKKVQMVKITPFQILTTPQKNSTQFPIANWGYPPGGYPTGGIPLSRNAISKTLNYRLAPNRNFLGKTGQH